MTSRSVEGMSTSVSRTARSSPSTSRTVKEVWQANVASVGTTAGTVRETNPWTVYVNGMILTSVNGGDSPLQGHLDALNAKTGALMWRWFSTPDPTLLPFILTWTNPVEAATGGAAVLGQARGRHEAEPRLRRDRQRPCQPEPRQESLDVEHRPRSTSRRASWSGTSRASTTTSGTTTARRRRSSTTRRSTERAVAAVGATCKPGYVFMLRRSNGSQIFPVKETPVPNPGNQPLGTPWPTQPETSGGSAQRGRALPDDCPGDRPSWRRRRRRPERRTSRPARSRCRSRVATEVWGTTSQGGPTSPDELRPGDERPDHLCERVADGRGLGLPTSGVGGLRRGPEPLDEHDRLERRLAGVDERRLLQRCPLDGGRGRIRGSNGQPRSGPDCREREEQRRREALRLRREDRQGAAGASKT